ncbi:uncharacterized protein OCT59_017876 [Rhizophagus irregularis]|uniref:Uncharacterized protein n=2 Tax=Rhizophagus irregularis TaxID=588596 RepID=A0A015JGS8_RHIIW|nr:hypothetical protein GLOIN_2v1781841 [Rhizophagus irregularis DAOM 181602=DAOM 197198]EXX68692.1 hypothetical protein RirG_102960 [Rhizophagus irregularis DAOM 197198w]UZO25611.1 hypothetical protein OCT59_017876 [Rhizophagus irregularis]POG65303.1 hypothetical protein GLOIN_2v1781841 [Rhizophagus irregularis DAOM 181602=DAOM 197198]CAG8535813.1 1380_t:CDS:2 [Rhizophagus irregularis]GBC46860.1 hypothetical protein GLOIN_2v1781841 [Rhizophagus irregularis DAOM 181602=DAOM 197198]|eukprot:XP_025172169.1 hypothetical protein GLOIN_2v1781841 [Rhizophagus irregularis DAOM 181602=DAOM 197198]
MKQENKSIYLISEQDSKIHSSSTSSSSIPHVSLIDENDSKRKSKKNKSLSNDFVCKNKKDRFQANKYSQSSTSSLTSLSTVKKKEYVDTKGINCIPIKIESSDDDDVIIVKEDLYEDSKADLKIIEIDEESDDSVRLGGRKRSAASKRRKPKKIWNSTDIELLFDGIELYGSKWNKVASHVGNDFRGIQCKRRWKSIKRQFIKQ